MLLMANDFYSAWVELYDLMIDWPKRLAREGAALLKLLDLPGPVLEVACGTGQHLAWLAGAGRNVVGTDLTAAMLAEAATRVAGVPLVQWSMADAVPPGLADRGPFAGLLCLGNSFPHVIEQAAVERTLRNFYELLAPAGRLVIGLKALAVLRDAGRQFLPLARRKTAAGDEVLFVRFYEFVAGPVPSAEFHIVIVGHDVPLLAPAGVHHAVTRLRVWRADELGQAVARAGFEDVVVAADLTGRPWQPGDSEDVFVIARRAN